MKDVAHHLHYIQKKNIQAARKTESPNQKLNGLPNPVAESPEVKPRKKFDPNHRKPRISKRIGFH